MKLEMKLLSIVFTFFLVACGGGGGGGGNTPTDNTSNDFTVETTKELAVAAKETSTQIVASKSDVALPKLSPSTTARNALKTALTASPEAQMALFSEPDGARRPRQATHTGSESVEGTCGGTGSYTYTVTSDDTNRYPLAMDYNWVLNDFCLDFKEGYQIVYNGTFAMDMYATDVENATYDYEFDFSYTTNFPGVQSGSLYYAESCTMTDGEMTCSTGMYESDTTTYHTSDVSVTGDAVSGYNISYTITDGDGNVCTVSFTGLTLCENGNIGSGNGTVTMKGQVINIEYISCDEFVVTYNGNTDTYNQ